MHYAGEIAQYKARLFAPSVKNIVTTLLLVNKTNFGHNNDIGNGERRNKLRRRKKILEKIILKIIHR